MASACDALIPVRVQPRASADAVVGERDGVIAIRLKAPPVDGQANAALLKFLARRLGLPQRDLTLVRGMGSRDKWVRVQGLSVEVVRSVLLA